MVSKPPVVIVAVVVACLVGLRGTAEGQGTLETVIPDFGVTCTSTGQPCEPLFTTPVATASLLQVRYAVHPTHCSSVRLHIFVDGVLVQTTGFLGWPAPDSLDLPLETELLELGPVSAGTHALALQAEGQVSGCNTGNLAAWGGSLRVVTAPLFGAVAASGTAVPGGSGVFTAFPQSPAVSAGSVAFLGLGSAVSEQGVYSCDISTPVDPCRKIADLATAIPDGTGTFSGFNEVAASSTVVGFLGTGADQGGVYSCDTSQPVDPCRKIADLATAIPEGTGTFTAFSDIALALVPPNPTRVAFVGRGVSEQGVYSCDISAPVDPCRRIADLATAIPDGTGTFSGFNEVAASSTVVGFLGTGADQGGVYSCDTSAPTDPCRKIADLATAIPEGTGTFTAFTDIALALVAANPTRVAFVGSGVSQQGVYSCDISLPTDPCRKIADLATAIPEGTGTFTGFTALSASDAHVAFLGLGDGGQAGIYLASTLTKVLAVGDMLDGKAVTALRMGRSGLDSAGLTFAATFADGTEGVYVLPVAYPFAGFFAPVDNLPVLNQAKAGSAIPVKFSLGGDRGLAIFAAGYPKSEQIACDSGALVDGVEQTVTADGSSLSYDPATDQYTYAWKTDKAWTKTCRQLVLKLIDQSVHVANFTFK